MPQHAIASVINFCTNDAQFLRACVNGILPCSSRIVVPVCDHFFDGAPEDRPTLEAVYSAFPECHFVEYPFLPELISSPDYGGINPASFWNNLSRWLAVRHYTDESIRHVFFLDADEAADGDRLLRFLDEVDYRAAMAVKFANYWYFREPIYRANMKEDSILLARREALDDVTLLRNEAVTISGLQFVGLEDLWSPVFDPGEIIIKKSGDASTIVLCHNPDTADESVWGQYEGWILCGHTHGGQCKPPFLPPPLLPVKNKRYTSGEFALSGNRRMYISRGVGHLLQVRFNVRPEIPVFRLQASG